MKQKIGKTRQTRTGSVDEAFDSGLGDLRGILRWPPPAGQFKHMRRRPPTDLQPWIDLYWMVTWDLSEPLLQETLPHPNIHLVFEGGRAQVGGVSTKKFSRLLQGKSGVFGVKFRPGAFRAFMKAPTASLLDRVVPANKIFGDDVERFETACREAAWNESKLMKASTGFFRGRIPKTDPKVARAGELVESILQNREIKTVDDLARHSRINKRSLQRMFLEYVGVNPKWVIRRFRLHGLLGRFNGDETPDWAEVAVELGYFDQAHLINDFRAIVGETPREYS